MKLVLSWLSLTVIAAALSCSVSHRSGEFTCVTSMDCVGEAAGRICSGGFCVVSGGGVDAPIATHDSGPIIIHDAPQLTCPSICTSCDLSSMTCKIACTGATANCANDVTCPPGFNCQINCVPGGSCKIVDCTDAASCSVTCTGQGSCRQVNCGATACDVQCTGSESCRGVACGSSCACDVACGDTASCQSVFCSHIECDDLNGGSGCSSSQDPLCNTCP